MNRGRMNSRGRRSAASEGGNGASPDSPEQGGRERQRGRSAGGDSRRPNWFVRHKILTAILGIVVVGGVILGVSVANALNDPLKVLKNRTPEPPPQTQQSTTGSSTPADTVSPTDGQTVAPTATEQPIDKSILNDSVNFLILGTDSSASRVNLGMNARTDCIMLLSINVVTNKASLISIPRDTYVKIYSAKTPPKVYAKNRINAAFTFGGGLKKNGITFAMNTVNQFLSGGKIPIDHYVLFNMDLVRKLIDKVGGVDVMVTNLSDDTITTETGFTFTNNTNMHMAGAMALAYARDRHHTKGGDQNRVGHQQDVMVALLKKLQDKGTILKLIPQLYSLFQSDITTDLTDPMQILALAAVAKDMNISNVKQYTVSGTGFEVNGGSMLVADQDKKAQIIEEVFGISGTADKSWTKSRLQGEIMALLNASKSAVNAAKSFLSGNQGYYTDAEAADLNAAIADWNAAAGRNDTDGCDDAAQDVQTQLDVLKNLVQTRKDAINNGRAKISWAKEQLSSLSDYINDTDKSAIHAKIDAVQTCVDNKDFDNVGAAASDLENTATPIFSVAQAAKDGASASTNPPEPTDAPPSTDPPTPTESPSQAPTDPPAAT